jgi:hypothetical protein
MAYIPRKKEKADCDTRREKQENKNKRAHSRAFSTSTWLQA